MDIVGPLPTAQGNFKFAVVAVEYFTKWIEARPLATITLATIRKFFWQQIICRFGVPKELTVDNGKQFDCQDFREYCRSIGTKLCFASVYHPQSNGAVERANGQIFSAVKKCLFEQKKGKWADEPTTPDDDYSSILGEESPCCSRSRNSSLLCSRCSRRRMLHSFLRAARSCSRRCAARALGTGA
jgi:transposase InsO family protein